MNNSLIRLIGWPATVLHGDPAVFDRWMWLKRHLQPGELRTLDAGSGSGAFTMYAARLGNEAVGISFDKRNNRVARERAELLGLPNVRFIDADLRELANQASELGEFDQIICLETIEHIKDDEEAPCRLGHAYETGRPVAPNNALRTWTTACWRRGFGSRGRGPRPMGLHVRDDARFALTSRVRDDVRRVRCGFLHTTSDKSSARA